MGKSITSRLTLMVNGGSNCSTMIIRCAGSAMPKDSEVSTRVRRSRGRGRYGEARLARKVNGVVVNKNKIVQLLSGRYVPIDIKHPPDVVNEMFAFESKWLTETPRMLQGVMQQAIRNAMPGYIPVGVIGDRTAKVVLYIMTERDFLKCFNVGRERRKENEQGNKNYEENKD